MNDVASTNTSATINGSGSYHHYDLPANELINQINRLKAETRQKDENECPVNFLEA